MAPEVLVECSSTSPLNIQHRLDLAAFILAGETRAAHNIAMQVNRAFGPQTEQQTRL